MIGKDQLRSLFEKCKSYVSESVTSDPQRIRLQYKVTATALGTLALVFGIADLAGKYWVPMAAALLFSSLAGLALYFMIVSGGENKGELILEAACTAMALFLLFEGGAAGSGLLWVLLLPAAGLFLFGLKRGGIANGIVMTAACVLYLTPWGRRILFFDESAVLLTRYPFVYLAVFTLGFFMDAVRRTLLKNYRGRYGRDSVTGLLSREEFVSRAGEMICRGRDVPIGLAIFDPDGFKTINDTYGHAAGDKILRMVAGKLEEITGKPLYRWDSERFVMLDPEGTTGEDAYQEMAAKFAKSEILLDGWRVELTVSIGAVFMSGGTDSLDDLLRESESCLIMAKNGGRNQAVYNRIHP